MLMLELLLNRGHPDVNLRSFQGSTALMEAVRARRREAVRLLILQETIRVDLAHANGATPVIVAADIGTIEIVFELVARSAIINAEIKG